MAIETGPGSDTPRMPGSRDREYVGLPASRQPMMGRQLHAAIFFGLVLFAVEAVYFFVRAEDHIYYWDHRGYWIGYWKSGLEFKAGFHDWIVDLRNSIWANDYNLLPVAPLLPFSIAFGYSRIGYIVATSVCYLLPAAILAAYVGWRFAGARQQTLRLVFLAITVLYVPFWRATLEGYPDIVGLIPLLGAILIVRTVMLSDRVRPGVAVLLGILIWAPFLFRRWYAFSIVAFVVTAPLYCFAIAILERTQPARAAFRYLVVNFFIAGVTAMASAAIMQGGVLVRVLQTDYSRMYAAYQKTLVDQLTNLEQWFGVFFLMLAAAGQIALLKGPRERADVIFINANIVMLFVLFFRTQSFSDQHYLPLAMWILFLIFFGLRYLQDQVKPAAFVTACIAMAAFFLALSPAFVLSNSPLFPAPFFRARLDHLGEYQRLTREIERILKADQKFTVFASSSLLNAEMLFSVSDEKLTDRGWDISHIDLRDGITTRSLMADIAVVATPVQTQAHPDAQQVVSIPAAELLSGQGIGAAYKRLPGKFILADGVEAYILEKTRPFTRDEVEHLLGKYFVSYPEWRSVYDTEPFLIALTASVELGDRHGRFDYQGGKLWAHPGASSPTSFSFDSLRRKLRVEVPTNCAGADGVSITVKSDGKTVQTVDINPTETKAIEPSPAGPVTIIVNPRTNPWCDTIAFTE